MIIYIIIGDSKCFEGSIFLLKNSSLAKKAVLTLQQFLP